MNRINSRSKKLAFLALSVVLTSFQSSQAASTACPVMLYGGKVNRGTVSLGFMNRGKVPIRELALNCGWPGSHSTRPSECHTEEGLFFPGTPYTLTFDNPDKTSHSIVISVKNAVLDGYIWSSTQDQPCRPLKVLAR
jgi:hypothetical protein